MARLRSPAQRAPQNKEQALALLERFAAKAGRAGEIAARRDSIIGRVNAIADAQLVPLEAELKDIVKQLKPWWAANVDELTGGKRKSIPLGGCVLGYRTSPPSVKFDGGTDDDATAAIVAAGLDLIRTRTSPDKPAILALLQFVKPDEPADDDTVRLERKATIEALGFRVHQPEVFFVDLPTRAADTGVVSDAGADVVA